MLEYRRTLTRRNIFWGSGRIFFGSVGVAGRMSMLMPITEPVTHAVARGASEIDLELFTFVERYATNLFRWDLILLFGKNPDAEWTSGEIAEKLHRGAFPTTKELDDLTYLRVLVRRYTPNRT